MSRTTLPDADLIGVDWGTSNLRVMRIGEAGVVLDQRSDPRGAGGLAPADFPVVLREVAGDWLDQGLPILICGMAGARDRWIEVPYQPCPAGPDGAAAGLVKAPGVSNVRIVPGVGLMTCSSEGDDRLADVIRGEETQVFGAFDEAADATAVLPGTHSKWTTIRAGRITAFRTFMTGELFAAIKKGTVLGGGMGDPGHDDDAFVLGVRRSLDDPAVTAALFSVRIARLDARLPDASLADYLSGLLIGAEIASQLAAGVAPDAPLVLIGTEALNRRYETALSLAGFTILRSLNGADVVARGLWRIWKTSLS